MIKIKQWNHKWFGLWRESGPKYQSCPSVHDFINVDNGVRSDHEGVVKYLENGRVIATTSRVNFPCVITGEIFQGSLSCRTDGEWLWWDDLSHYFNKHNLRLPDEMLASILKNSYIVPLVSDEKIEKLEWPNL